MPGYPVVAAYYAVSVRCSLVLPSASFSQPLARLTLLGLVDRYNSAHRGLSPPSFTPCPASHHINAAFTALNLLKIEDQRQSKPNQPRLYSDSGVLLI